jgi:Fe-S-cluster containining protein
MAIYTAPELVMMGKYYGEPDLLHNELFWLDCQIIYRDCVVPLPLTDNPETRKYLHGLLECPSGKCGACCRYSKTPITKTDIKRLPELKPVVKTGDMGKLYFETENGCPFLVDEVCSVYKRRPEVCREFPIQFSREAIAPDKTTYQQMQYRIKCVSSLKVIREVLTKVLENDTDILLPDLTLVPKSRNMVNIQARLS